MARKRIKKAAVKGGAPGVKAIWWRPVTEDTGERFVALDGGHNLKKTVHKNLSAKNLRRLGFDYDNDAEEWYIGIDAWRDADACVPGILSQLANNLPCKRVRSKK